MHDQDANNEPGASREQEAPAQPQSGRGQSQDAARLTPVLVEQAADYLGVVWVWATRSELAVGSVFTARGRRYVITGLSPSGVTHQCREFPQEEGP